jgi:hypothetical protein
MADVGRDFPGFLACGLVLCTFAMTSMRQLRIVAMSSNPSFIGYGDRWNCGPSSRCTRSCCR